MATLSVSALGADLKVILVGSTGTGKTCLFERYLNNHYAGDSHRVTVGASFGGRTLNAKGRPVRLGIWDTAGSERYESMTRTYFRNAGAAIICYEISSEATFERAIQYCNEIQQCEPDCKMYFCGTKLDLVVANPSLRAVDLNTVCKYAAGINAAAIETSSKSGENIAELFDLIAEDFANDPTKSDSNQATGAIQLKEKSTEKSSNCCTAGNR